ncbi:MAG: hypothetical protein AAF770_02585 [Bacteroidota bacterium]
MKKLYTYLLIFAIPQLAASTLVKLKRSNSFAHSSPKFSLSYTIKKPNFQKYKVKINHKNQIKLLLAGVFLAVVSIFAILYIIYLDEGELGSPVKLKINGGKKEGSNPLKLKTDDKQKNLNQVLPDISTWSLETEKSFEASISMSLADAIQFVDDNPNKRWKINSKCLLLNIPTVKLSFGTLQDSANIPSQAVLAVSELADLGVRCGAFSKGSPNYCLIKEYVNFIDEKSADLTNKKKDHFKQDNYAKLILLHQMGVQAFSGKKKVFKNGQSLETILQELLNSYGNCYGHINAVLGKAVSPFHVAQTISSNILLILLDEKEYAFNSALARLFLGKNPKYTSMYSSSDCSAIDVHLLNYLLFLTRSRIVVPGTQHAVNDSNGYKGRGEYVECRATKRKLTKKDTQNLIMKEFNRVFKVDQLIKVLIDQYNQPDNYDSCRLNTREFADWVYKHGITKNKFSELTNGITQAPPKKFWYAVLYAMNVIC